MWAGHFFGFAADRGRTKCSLFEICVMSSNPTVTRPSHKSRFAIFERLGHLAVHRKKTVLAAFVLLLILCAGLGLQALGSLSGQGYDDPGSASSKAATVLNDKFKVYDPAISFAVVAGKGLTVDSPKTVSAVKKMLSEIQKTSHVGTVESYWSEPSPAAAAAFRGKDGRTGEIVVWTSTQKASTVTAVARDLATKFGTTFDGVSVHPYGAQVVTDAINKDVTNDLSTAEKIAVPITLILLLFVFGSLVSAGLPFIVALGSIFGSFFVVWLITLTSDVSVFALNLITGLGLGLGVDYALLMVNRFREELKKGSTTEQAVVRTVGTAGKTVFVSGFAVMLTLSSLLFFPQYFLRSFAYAGVSVTLLAVVTALTALPALLAILGPRVDKLRVRKGELAPKDNGLWEKMARRVMERPVLVLVAVLVGVGLIASPALVTSFGQADVTTLPASNPAVVTDHIFEKQFPGQNTSVNVIIPGGAHSSTSLLSYAESLSKVKSVTSVLTPTGMVVKGKLVPGPVVAKPSYVVGSYARLTVYSNVSPRSGASQTLVTSLRGVSSSFSGVLMGGEAAAFTDSQAAIVSHLPWVLGWILFMTLLILFLYTGSVFIPIKALVLNVISLGATLGVLTWVFQLGNAQWLVGSFTVTGTLDTSLLVLVAVVAFALSMDYEVFLLSRIKEQHDAGHNLVESVAFGLQRSGRIITAAALLLAVVFASFVFSGVTDIKLLGMGIAFAIVFDATIVRAFLVPAVMKLAGNANWWTPPPLRRFYARFGITDD